MLLMIPGPIEVSPAVLEAYSVPPPGHFSPDFVEAFGASLAMMRGVWLAGPDSQPFVVAGSGTLAMELALNNVVDPGQRVIVVHTGVFSARIAEMARRRGAEVTEVVGEPGEVPPMARVERAFEGAPVAALIATHVDTSSGVRVDARALAQLARGRGALSVFDGVCATAGERFEMEAWGADIYLTASQKAIGLPVGLALLVASGRALEARDALKVAPSLSIDWHQWVPVMRAYEAGKPSYFSTPATNLIMALRVSLGEMTAEGMAARFDRHERAADAVRAACRALGLSLLPASEDVAANTLSAIRYPEGVGPELIGAIKDRGVVVAGGLYPGLQARTFRVGHMGYATERPDMILKTVEAIEQALIACGHPATPGAGVEAAARALGV